MQPPSLNPVSTTNQTTGYPSALATIAAIVAALAVPFALIPFAGLAASMLVLGFVAALSISTHRKRAFIGTGIAFLAVIISIISSFLTIGAIVESRNAATTKLAQMQTQLEALKTQASTPSDKSALGGIIKMFDSNNDLTNEQANTLGKLGEWIIKSATSDQSSTSDENKK